MIASVARVLGNLRAPRMLAFLVCDAAVLSVALLLAFMLRFEGIMPAEYRGRLPALVGVSILTNLPVFYAFGLYRMSWRYTSFYELINVFEGVTIGALLFG